MSKMNKNNQEGVDWILGLKAFLVSGKLLEKESQAKRVTRQATGYCVKDGDLYRRHPSGITLKCISTPEGQKLLRDIHVGACGHHSSAGMLAGKAYRSGFYWPSALSDATEMVRDARRASSMPSKSISRCKDCKPSCSLGPLLFVG
jgi:hypothetical protein